MHVSIIYPSLYGEYAAFAMFSPIDDDDDDDDDVLSSVLYLTLQTYKSTVCIVYFGLGNGYL